MKSITLAHQVDWDGWRTAARTLALDGIAPEEVVWSVGTPDDLFAKGERPAASPATGSFTVPRALVSLAESASRPRSRKRRGRPLIALSSWIACSAKRLAPIARAVSSALRRTGRDSSW